MQVSGADGKYEVVLDEYELADAALSNLPITDYKDGVELRFSVQSAGEGVPGLYFTVSMNGNSVVEQRPPIYIDVQVDSTNEREPVARIATKAIDY